MPQWVKDWWKAFTIAFRGWYGKIAISIFTGLFGLPVLYQRLRSNVGAFSMADLAALPSDLPTGLVWTLWEIGLGVILIILWVSTLRWIVKTRATIKGAWYQLAVLREKGVGLRNDGLRISPPIYREVYDKRSFLEWLEMTNSWYEETKTEVAKISEADAVWFGCMDIIPVVPRISHFNPLEVEGYNYIHALALHDERLSRLGEMISPLVGSRLRGEDK
jgi:hypothetical protein